MGLALVHERCAGIDVHKRQVTVCVQVPGRHEAREFATDTAALLALVDWLRELRIDDIAMEATGSYWKPVYNLFEATGMRPIVGNAAHLKAVPGRRTDVKDAEWLCDLHRHGLVKASFIPARARRELREVSRYRSTVVAERAAEANRIAKVLEGGNIKLASVVTDSLGVSSREMLAALASGVEDPELLAKMARGRLESKHDELVAALRGRMTDHQRKILLMQLEHVSFLDAQIAQLDALVAERLGPLEPEIERLDSIPGVSQRTAEVILAEIGADMAQFPSADHLISWAGMCPGNNQSGGKRRNGRTRKGNQALRAALVTSGQAAGRSKNTYKHPMVRIAEVLVPLVTAEGVSAEDPEVAVAALNLAAATGVDFADAHLALRSQRSGEPVCTFDRTDFAKMPCEWMEPPSASGARNENALTDNGATPGGAVVEGPDV